MAAIIYRHDDRRSSAAKTPSVPPPQSSSGFRAIAALVRLGVATKLGNMDRANHRACQAEQRIVRQASVSFSVRILSITGLLTACDSCHTTQHESRKRSADGSRPSDTNKKSQTQFQLGRSSSLCIHAVGICRDRSTHNRNPGWSGSRSARRDGPERQNQRY